jgi:Flp pilus assembly protein TadD
MNGIKRMAMAIGVAWVVAATLLAQQTSKAQEWPELTSRLERAVLRGMSKEVRPIRTELLRRLTQPEEKPNAPLIQYTIAYAGWRLANTPEIAEAEQGDLLDDAVSRLQEIVKTDPKDAEAHALLGSVLGVQAGRSPARAMVLGPRASSAIGRSASLD